MINRQSPCREMASAYDMVCLKYQVRPQHSILKLAGLSKCRYAMPWEHLTSIEADKKLYVKLQIMFKIYQ
jgi:hypothetical protein